MSVDLHPEFLNRMMWFKSFFTEDRIDLVCEVHIEEVRSSGTELA